MLTPHELPRLQTAIMSSRTFAHQFFVNVGLLPNKQPLCPCNEIHTKEMRPVNNRQPASAWPPHSWYPSSQDASHWDTFRYTGRREQRLLGRRPMFTKNWCCRRRRSGSRPRATAVARLMHLFSSTISFGTDLALGCITTFSTRAFTRSSASSSSLRFA